MSIRSAFQVIMLSRWREMRKVIVRAAHSATEFVAQAAAHLEAVSVLDAIMRESKLTAARQDWPQLLRDALAKLPPEQAEAR
jgi:hypothetical protein